MDRHPRHSAELALSDRIRSVIGALRARAGVDTPADLDVDRVRDVEAAIGSVLPEDLLGLMASGIPSLRDELGMELARVLEHTALAREGGVQGDFVGVGEADGHVVYGFLKGSSGAGRIYQYDNEDRSLQSWPVHEWLLRHMGLEASELGAGPASTFVARLIRVHEAAGAPAGARRVRHRSWGDGVVLAEHGDGPTRKVKAEFPSVGLKTVQARFLEYVDD